MKNKRNALVSTAVLVLGLAAMTANYPAAADQAAEAGQAIAKAEEQLKAVKAAGHEWRLIDKLTGARSESISKILEAAKKKHEMGEYDEVIRAANRVADAAMLGVQQAQQDATPFYQ